MDEFFKWFGKMIAIYVTCAFLYAIGMTMRGS